MARLSWIDLLPEGMAAAAALAVGLVEAGDIQVAGSRVWLYLIVVLCTVAVGLARRLPSIALALGVVAGVLHLEHDVPLLLVEVAYCVVIFGAARWGRAETAAAALLLLVVTAISTLVMLDAGRVGSVADYLPGPVIRAIAGTERSWQLIAGVVLAVVLLVPWLLGIVARLLARAADAREAQVAAQAEAEQAHRDAEQAQHIARLEESRVRLAHDVHDVVGHSLAVILAQAESGQYAADTETLKRTLATIATSARSSLQDVRQVLQTGEGRSGTLQELIDGVRTSGHAVEETVTGEPRPLPPELETVAYRVLQEMLTNALRHGRRDGALRVTQEWGERLTLRVSNTSEGDGDVESGQGLDGMRRRLVAVGGTLLVEPGEEFTVTATIPVRAERP